MTSPPRLTDRPALLRHRARSTDAGMFLHQETIQSLQDRLMLVNRQFTSVAIVTGFADIWRSAFPDAKVVEDCDTLDLTPGAHDLVIHAMSLHWANDPVGQLIQCKRALRADGLFLCACLGGQTLQELRAVFAEVETKMTGGLSPRVLPMAEIRDLGALLQRAGFALPVADAEPLTVSYKSDLSLMHDLRAMGETNAMINRHKTPISRAMLAQIGAQYEHSFPNPNGGVIATYDLLYLTGWAPDESQPKPLRPGSAAARLADALGTEETKLKD